MANYYQTGSTIGVNLNATSATAQFTLGTRISASDGSTWVYCVAVGAIEAYDVCTVDEDFNVRCGEIANAMTGEQLAFAQIAFATTEYGWVPINGIGNLLVTVSAHSTLNTVLYIGTVSGHLSTTSSSATVAGVAIQTANSTSTNATPEIIASWPRIGPSTSGL